MFEMSIRAMSECVAGLTPSSGHHSRPSVIVDDLTSSMGPGLGLEVLVLGLPDQCLHEEEPGELW